MLKPSKTLVSDLVVRFGVGRQLLLYEVRGVFSGWNKLSKNPQSGAPDDLTTLMALGHQLPPRTVYSTFSVARKQLPYAALAPLIGANVRVGLDDNLYLSRWRLATIAELVQRAREILERISVRIMAPDEVRE
ncbi:3-keto-5-aminohexanoate cleavage protein [Bradyrhizobium yuanmingense]|uniref:3-keto-5-aminohexanoate cleavage protein n=1 Tax=Bradyrhizobium yuanmingense TaxID=108015 RepID=UPI0023B8EA99|nr:3-keto-5-aminohexanoate cleavage protein [Bradyrhizobium yuanmingense]MDF0523388.1 3-keto-5-aminohexanoate cleavage protein [Bradyrhizobium yuanmingense]